MSFLSQAWIEIDVPPELAFDTLADHPSWKDWMPKSFSVASPAKGPHTLGNKFAMYVEGAPGKSGCRISQFDRAKTIAWCGGVKGLLHADHEFFFSSDGKGGTKIHSHERWSGVLAMLLRGMIQPSADRIAGEQLAGLKSACLARSKAT